VIASHAGPPITAQLGPSFAEICDLCSRRYLLPRLHQSTTPPPSPIDQLIIVDMGFFDTWSDLVAAAAPWSAVEAEAVESAEPETKVRLDSIVLFVAILRMEGLQGPHPRRNIVAEDAVCIRPAGLPLVSLVAEYERHITCGFDRSDLVAGYSF
jgi:hypothetical protein